MVGSVMIEFLFLFWSKMIDVGDGFIIGRLCSSKKWSDHGPVLLNFQEDVKSCMLLMFNPFKA